MRVTTATTAVNDNHAVGVVKRTPESLVVGSSSTSSASDVKPVTLDAADRVSTDDALPSYAPFTPFVRPRIASQFATDTAVLIMPSAQPL